MYYDFFKSVLTTQECQKISDIMVKKVQNNQYITENICTLSKCFYSMLPNNIIDKFRPLVTEFAKCNINFTYDYARIYPRSEVLPMHIDRIACQYSVTVCIRNTSDSWPFWVTNPDTQISESFVMSPGDCLLYKGCEVPHWRDPNPYADVYQVFLHFCDDQTYSKVSKTEPRIVEINDRKRLRSMFCENK